MSVNIYYLELKLLLTNILMYILFQFCVGVIILLDSQ